MKQARAKGLPVSQVQRHRDTKFTKSFDAALKRKRVKVVTNAYRSPNTNAYVEWFSQSIQQDCLNRFIVFGTQHLDHLGAEYLAHYHEERPHQSLENEPLVKPKKCGRPATKRGKTEDEMVRLADVRCSKRPGGLLKSYSRRAA